MMTRTARGHTGRLLQAGPGEVAVYALIVTFAMGVRQAFGLFLPQMSASLDIGRGEFGLALAI